MKSISSWFQRRFVGTELGTLALISCIIILALSFMGGLLAPVLASIVIAYLLDGVVRRLEKWHFPDILAVSIVFLLFLGIVVVGLVFLLPLLWDQLISLLTELPGKIKEAEGYFTHLSQLYPDYVSREEIQKWATTFQSDFAKLGTVALSFSIATISNTMMIIVYAVLVPLMVFFMLKDRDQIVAWTVRFLPKNRRLSREVWVEINESIGNYIRGKVLEIIIVGITTTIIFLIFGLNYAILLGVLVGVSSIVPYVGVILVTIPVAIVGYLQWGFEAHFLYLMIVYFGLMILDGNVLTPILFSETMKLHPVAVIIAVLIFGGLWGHFCTASPLPNTVNYPQNYVISRGTT